MYKSFLVKVIEDGIEIFCGIDNIKFVSENDWNKGKKYIEVIYFNNCDGLILKKCFVFFKNVNFKILIELNDILVVRVGCYVGIVVKFREEYIGKLIFDYFMFVKDIFNEINFNDLKINLLLKWKGLIVKYISRFDLVEFLKNV